MRMTKKLATIGAGAGLFTASIIAMPFGGSVSAAATALGSGSNKAVDVQTELDCVSHTLTAKVTNKTTGEISPGVSFDKWMPPTPGIPIKPGDTGMFVHNYTGNNIPLAIEVAVDTYAPLKLNETLNCQEPLSFRVTDASESGVGGWITNNSSLVSQTALVQANNGSIQVVDLGKGESRYVPIPFSGVVDQQYAFLRVGTTNGFQGTYMIDLERPIAPPIPEPLPKGETKKEE